MTGTTSDRVRAWRGPAVLSYGFRPFFLLAGVWAVLLMVVWVLFLAGVIDLPVASDPLSWHAHEALFGYLGAVMGGFLLTAVPNWTGRLPVVGWPLAGLALLWLLGRAAFAFSALLSPWVVAVADLSLSVALAGFLAREIVTGRNWRNLPVLALVCLFGLANLVVHVEIWGQGTAYGGVGLRLGLGIAVLMVALIGGRIVPSFTRNWLVKRGDLARPKPFGPYDKLVMAGSVAALALWVAWPGAPVTAMALLLFGAAHLARLARWAGGRTTAEPLVLVLHVAYAMVPLGAIVQGLAILTPGLMPVNTAAHVWLVGAVGGMTLAVMTRATLGHTGRALTAGPGTSAIFVMLFAAVGFRVLAGLFTDQALLFQSAAALAWIGAFAAFTGIYGPLLLRARPDR